MQMGQGQPGATAILAHPEMHQQMPTQQGNYMLNGIYLRISDGIMRNTDYKILILSDIFV